MKRSLLSLALAALSGAAGIFCTQQVGSATPSRRRASNGNKIGKRNRCTPWLSILNGQTNGASERDRRIRQAIARTKTGTFCLGTGCMQKCKTCQHENNWQLLNLMTNKSRLAAQATMRSVNTDACQITGGRYYLAK